MATVGTAFVQIVPSFKGGVAAISAQMDGAGAAAGASSGKKFGASFGGAAKGAIAIGAATAVVAAGVSFARDAIAEAREAQKVGAVTAQVIKTTGGAANVSAAAVAKLSSAISKKTGVDDEAVQSGANLLLTFTNVQNQAGKGNDIFNRATAAVQDMAVAFHQDAGSSAKQLGKALQDPIKGVTALNRVGVQFNKQQKDQIKTLVESGDTLGAQKIILAEIAKESGGAAAAQATAGDKAKVSWNNLKESLGTQLLPVIDKVLVGFTALVDWMAAHQTVMLAFAIVVGVLAVALTIAAVAAVIASIPFIGMALVIGLIVAAVIFLAVVIAKNWDAIKKKTASVWGGIKSFLTGLWDGIKAKASAMWNGLKSLISTAWNGIKTAVSSGAKAVLTFVVNLAKDIVNAYLFLPRKMLAIGKDIVLGLRDGIVAAWHFVTDKVEALIAKIPLAIRKLMGIASPSKVMMELGAFMSQGLAVGIDSGRADIAASLRGLTPRVAVDGSVGASSTAAGQRQMYLKSGALEIVNGKAYISGVISEQAFDFGMASA